MVLVYGFCVWKEKIDMAIKDIIRNIFNPNEKGMQRGRQHFSQARSQQFVAARPLEGAGRAGWDTEQNSSYGRAYGNPSGPSTFVERGEIKHYRGRGPKNYKRSDDRIKEDICDFLTDDHLVDANEIEVTVSGGEVILSGYVSDRSAKRRAEDIAESVNGVKTSRKPFKNTALK